MDLAAEGTPRTTEIEVSDKAKRRQFSAAEKRRILEEADRCEKPGELGALLRREGIYSSHLAAWRKARRERGEAKGLDPQKRGPKAAPRDERDVKVAKLERENARLARELERAKAVIDIQKKVAELLGIPLAKAGEES